MKLKTIIDQWESYRIKVIIIPLGDGKYRVQVISLDNPKMYFGDYMNVRIP